MNLTLTTGTTIVAAPAITINVEGQPMVATLRKFSTGSWGYFASGKVALPNGATLQVSANLVICKSKPE